MLDDDLESGYHPGSICIRLEGRGLERALKMLNQELRKDSWHSEQREIHYRIPARKKALYLKGGRSSSKGYAGKG